MALNKKHKIIAFFLLLVFSFSSIAGFACSIGIDMGYNKKHHEHSEAALHHALQNFSGGHHQHKAAFQASLTASGRSEDCCTNDVTAFAKLDKSVADNHLTLQPPIFLFAFTTAFLLQNEDETGGAVNSRFQFVRRSSFLNNTDIRIAIQSFQI